MEKILVKQNQSFIREAEKDFTEGVKIVNNLIEDFNDIAQIRNIGDINELLAYPAKYIVSKMDLKSNDLTKQFADEKLLELLESSKPLSLSKQVTEINGDFRKKRQLEIALKYGVLEAGTLKKDPVKFKEYSEKGNIYAVSEREKEIYQAISRVLKGLEFINNSVRTQNINWDNTEIPFLTWNGNGFELNEHWYKTHISE